VFEIFTSQDICTAYENGSKLLKTSKFVVSYKIRQINALPEQKIVVSL